MPVFNDLSGSVFGRLTILHRAPNRGRKTFWFVECDCGTVKQVSASSLTHCRAKFRVTSCGCFQRELASKRFKIHGMSGTLELSMYQNAKRRAKEKNLQFDLNVADIKVPAICPLLGIPLFKVGGKITENSPSVDRRDPNRGYVKDNIWVISYKANSAKSNCTLQELELLVKNLRNETR